MCLVVGFIANKMGRSFLGFTFLSVVISPIGGLIVVLVVGKKEEPGLPPYFAANAQQQRYMPEYQSQPEVRPQQLVSSSASSELDAATDVSFCPKCGAKIVDPETQFCPKCGNKMES